MNLLICLSLVALLFLPAAVLLPILGGYAAMRWREQGCRDILLLVAVGGFVVPIVLGFAGLGTGPINTYMRGSTRYAEARADIEAMRKWLSAQDSSDYTDGHSGVSERFLEKAEQPPAVPRLRPKTAKVLSDEAGHLTLRLLWGGGLIGHCGIVVGREDMPMPPSDSHTQHVPLAPGAYIWSGD